MSKVFYKTYIVFFLRGLEYDHSSMIRLEFSFRCILPFFLFYKPLLNFIDLSRPL